MIYPESNQVNQYEYQPIDPAEEFELNEIERPPSFTRKFVELLFYVIVAIPNFTKLSFFLKVPYLMGALVMVSGFLTFVIILAERRKIPTVVYCAIFMNLGANISQVIGQGELPLIGEYLPYFLHWLTFLTMVSYLVQNKAANYRILFFLAVLIIATVWGGGVLSSGGDRLDLSGIEAGAAFSNANQLAYVSGFFSVAILFWSLRASKLLRPFLWAMAVFLAFLLIRTISRGGMLVFACGIMVLLFLILMGRGVRLSGIVLIVVSLLVVLQLSYIVAGNFELLGERLGEESIRTKIYSMETLKQILGSLIFGGGYNTRTSAGVSAHNAFINTYLCYGGITIWPYIILLWILGVRMLRMFRADNLDSTIKFTVIALFGMSFGCLMFSNLGYMFWNSIYALAVVEKYTAPYSKRRIKNREAMELMYYSPEDEFE